jgi:hypothetical protein
LSSPLPSVSQGSSLPDGRQPVVLCRRPSILSSFVFVVLRLWHRQRRLARRDLLRSPRSGVGAAGDFPNLFSIHSNLYPLQLHLLRQRQYCTKVWYILQAILSEIGAFSIPSTVPQPRRSRLPFVGPPSLRSAGLSCSAGLGVLWMTVFGWQTQTQVRGGRRAARPGHPGENFRSSAAMRPSGC